MKHVLSVLVENQPGVLSRVSGMFSRRGFNIDSLAVGITDDPQTSRITVIVRGDRYVVDQITKQLQKLIDVKNVCVLDVKQAVIRELVLVKVRLTADTRAEILQTSDIFRAKVVDISHDTLTLEITGDCNKVKALLSMLDAYGVLEVVRTGSVAIARGTETIYNTLQEGIYNENVL